MTTPIEFKKGICYVGLVDVVGGKLCYCVSAEQTTESKYFPTKAECRKYIKENFRLDERKELLCRLDKCNGRAYIHF